MGCVLSCCYICLLGCAPKTMISLDISKHLACMLDEYINHMKDIMTDRDAIMGHVYVLHMGDLSGGQMIARKAPGEGRMYQFDTDKKELKESIRAKINDDMAEEAKYCFTSSTNLFKELMELDIEPYLEQTN